MHTLYLGSRPQATGCTIVDGLSIMSARVLQQCNRLAQGTLLLSFEQAGPTSTGLNGFQSSSGRSPADQAALYSTCRRISYLACCFSLGLQVFR